MLRALVVALAAVPLHVDRVPLPPLPAPHYDTRGSYPQVSRAGHDLRKVNAALRGAVVAEEARYARSARRDLRDNPWNPRQGLGIFWVERRPRLVSATTRVVSTLMPFLELYPGGNDGSIWLAVNVLVPSGERVSVVDLFARQHSGLVALARAVRARMLQTNPCVRGSLESNVGFARQYYEHGFDPTARHYRHFALLPGGLAIGFDLGFVAGPPCGRVYTVVPYAAIRAFLSPLGATLTPPTTAD